VRKPGTIVTPKESAYLNLIRPTRRATAGGRVARPLRDSHPELLADLRALAARGDEQALRQIAALARLLANGAS
jgi:hypothetical protein